MLLRIKGKKMSRNRLKRVLFILIVLIALLACFAGIAFGASATASISGGGTYEVGSTVNVNFSYSGTTFGTSKTIFNYNTSVLQFQGCTAVSGGTSGVTTVSMTSGGSNSLNCTLTFKVVGTGSTNISASTSELYNINGEALTANTVSTTISGKNPAPQVSGNANLASLKVSAGSLSPAFSPSRTSYTVNVGKDVSVCTISATPEHSKASVSVSGSKNLSEGKNVRTVTVTAENGSTKTYTITINRGKSTAGEDDPNPDNPDNPDTPEVDVPQDIVVTVGDIEYTIVESVEEGDIPKGFALTLAQYGEYDIPVIKDTNLKYTFVLLKNSNTGDQEWFFYDEETDSFSSSSQLSVDEALEYSKLLAELNGEEDDSLKLGKTEKILIMSLGGTLAAMFIAIIALQTKIIKKNKAKTNKESKEKVIIEDKES